MMSSRMRPRVVGIAATAALVVIVNSLLAPSASAEAPASDRKVAAFEVDFLIDMIDHHAMAGMMAEQCTEQVVPEDMARICESIVQTQSREILQMQHWLASRYGVTHEPDMTPGQMRSMTRLDRLDGEGYEVAFMRAMIRHHWLAIREAESCLDNAEHPELLSLCESIRSTQLGEIAIMQGWLEQWYDRRGGRALRGS